MTSAELRKAGLFRTADAMELIEIVEQQHRYLEQRYNELVMSVARVFPDETRHQTALRYIVEAERASVGSESDNRNASLSERTCAPAGT